MANINWGMVEGLIGKINVKPNVTIVSINHKQSWVDKKTNKWQEKEQWIYVSFFQKRAEWVQRRLQVGMPVIIKFELSSFQTEGAKTVMSLTGIDFWAIQKIQQKEIAQVPTPNDASNEPNDSDF